MDKCHPLVVDLETTMLCPVGNNKANPFWPENYAVMLGALNIESGKTAVLTTTVRKEPRTIMGSNRLLVGHNITFDLHYLWKMGIMKNEDAGKLQIWDTQQAAYILSAQQHKFAKLNDLAVAAGGTVKDSVVTKVFESGLGAEHVDPTTLEAYLREDLENTYRVFVKQFDQTAELNLTQLMWTQMDARLACAEMMYNGMHVNTATLKHGMDMLTSVVNSTATTLQHRLHLKDADFKLNSTKDIGIYLFGGTVKKKEKVADGVYKTTGKPKYKTVEVEVKHPALAPMKWASVLKSGAWAVTEEILNNIVADPDSCKDVSDFCAMLHDWRKATKQLTTYYQGIHALVMPDSCIHHKLNQCATNTGRLSSSEPNLQNVTDVSTSDVKKIFTSRWGLNGSIIEVDYSQLEMIALAVLASDFQLKEDIIAGVDMHTQLYVELFRRLPTKDERRQFKRAAFALIYGGGANAIAAQSGITPHEARLFIKKFYARYPGVQKFHESLMEDVRSMALHEGERDKETGMPYFTSIICNKLTGRRLYFREYPQGKPGQPGVVEMSFSPTETKNYPVQSFATADIVPLMLGKMFRVLKNSRLASHCLMVNTVHDSVLFDCHNSVLDDAVELIQTTLSNVRGVFQDTFGVDLGIDFKVEVKTGPTWGDLVEWR